MEQGLRTSSTGPVGDQIVSIVRENLMTRPGYAPYCGNGDCILMMPRARWDGEQFNCRCGWRSRFPTEFIEQYKAKWELKP